LLNPDTSENNPQNRPCQVLLTVIHGPLKGTEFPVDDEEIVIGSGPDVAVRLSGGEVSPRHAGLRWQGGYWEVFDLTGEKFPVNDIPTQRRTLGGGEIFRIGDHELHFTLCDSAATVDSEPAQPEPETVLLIELEKGKTLDGIDKISIVAGPGYTIGRTPGNDMAIKDPLASRRHCRIEVIDGSAVLTDLGSLNGTHLEGRPIHQATLRAGDLIVAGKTALRCLRP